MDSTTEADLRTAFKIANAQSGDRWQMLDENAADFVIVDMDSMYGPMSWLRLHAAGKRVIGLTSAPRTQTDYRLGRPLNPDGFTALLTQIALENGVLPKAPIAPVAPPPAPAPSAPKSPAPAVPSGMSPAPLPQDQLPEERPQPVKEEAKAPPPAPTLPASVAAGTLAPTTIKPSTAALPPAHTPAVPRGLADWLAPGLLAGRVRYGRNAGPTLLIDPASRQYHGPAALKSLASYFEGVVVAGDFAAVDPAAWARESTALGAAQPLSRLQWYGALLAGKGKFLLPGYDPTGHFRLTKWPQTEREFPKHFRIATAMMKGPATLDEVAAASGVAREEVIDFVNANLATGYAEQYQEPEPEPDSQKSGGLFGRLRGK
ncbi:hypothetical protein [Lysobacter sp. CFH 32150]|uniref:hypothetical protein n=1 Tax=Lysobacter sp. CFH 32150 TaxID=2927128 RepID=UPI001FA7F68C|nr:hypothetical protein [Lysobacter sp. CFH 32150]MCI4566946.1 hypothetical protein [Lysobacter sp. CFH 32150]